MIRVTAPSGPAAPAPSRKASKAGASFHPEGGARAEGAGARPAIAESQTLSALIALQSEAAKTGARAKRVIAAQRMIDLLERIRDGLLDGRPAEGDLDALAHAANARPPAGEEDEGLAALYDEIALRARVELAKRGR